MGNKKIEAPWDESIAIAKQQIDKNNFAKVKK